MTLGEFRSVTSKVADTVEVAVCINDPRQPFAYKVYPLMFARCERSLTGTGPYMFYVKTERVIVMLNLPESREESA